MKVGIVGCGEIARKHITFIRSIRNTEIVGISDNNYNQLEKYSKQYNINNRYESLSQMIASQKLDVVHILTPPFSHKALALEAIEKGIHVYIEKPLALNSDEAKNIYNAAKFHNVKVCVGVNFMFDPCVLKTLDIINEPNFGRIIYIEYFYGSNMRRYDRLKTTKENEIHWSYYLPGGFHQNYISHPLYMITKFIGKPKNIQAACQSSGALPQDLTDEIRVLFEGEKNSGLLALSFSCEPYQHYIKIFGEKQAVKINIRDYTTTFIKTIQLPKVLTRVIFNNLSEAYQLSTSTISNIWQFLTGRLVPYQGMGTLIEMFYKSIESNVVSPVPPDLVLTAEEIADKIWRQCRNLHLDFNVRIGSQKNIIQKEKVLVTGASGFVGLHTVRRLVKEGYKVRAFVRKLSYIKQLEELGVEIYFGDIRNYESFKKASEGVDVIIHLAAAMNVPSSEYEEITVEGVKNLIKIAKVLNISKIVYMSSMSVYDREGKLKDFKISEDYILEQYPEKRGAYTLSKVKAEKLVLQELYSTDTRWTILRPSIIYGIKKRISFKQIGGLAIGDKIRIVFGSGRKKLRLIHVEDVIDAIILSIKNNQSDGKIYNVGSENLITKKKYIQNHFKNGITIFVPTLIIYLGIYFQEILCSILGRKPVLTRSRFLTSQKDLTLDYSKILNDLGWIAKNTIQNKS